MCLTTKQPALARNAEDSRDGKRDTKAPKSNQDDKTRPISPESSPKQSSHQYHSLPGPSQPFASSTSEPTLPFARCGPRGNLPNEGGGDSIDVQLKHRSDRMKFVIRIYIYEHIFPRIGKYSQELSNHLK